jgi:hypothetical protein
MIAITLIIGQEVALVKIAGARKMGLRLAALRNEKPPLCLQQWIDQQAVVIRTGTRHRASRM